MSTFTDVKDYKTQVWSLQCSYGKLVISYNWNLQLGNLSPDLKDTLVISRNIFKILNDYDTRDIGTGLCTYNKFTESEMYSLVSKLKSFLN